MSALTHANGVPVCRIYKDPEAIYGDAKTQGATVAFNVQDSLVMPIAYSDVEKLADEHNIYLRSSGLCNPGGIATFQNFTASDVKAIFALGHRYSKPLTPELLGGKMPGVVRVSLGAMSTFSDVDTFLAFMSEQYVEKYQPIERSPTVLEPVHLLRPANLPCIYHPPQIRLSWKSLQVALSRRANKSCSLRLKPACV
ncbi:uncharacterized protein BDZ99DRAFT_468963 [Mytilinidion resinicola]|uniref:PLP-dependent transferase n=1 Tax=Mytilinidion resinicola TaxID=574789 RepID=A0A6A6Y1X2_9PEZI|nr:uncharacterized protein BDZ99DRAFT_468963 [Mytilinidion resinicola]KAF2802513.1 hypothetical protein BDZ99DRAFT_468963 [Mytilinidion resinicola]